MKRLTFSMMLVAAAALAGCMMVAEQDKKEEQPLRLELDLTDGSRVVGVPGIESVPVQTPYTRKDLPLKQIRTLKIGKDRETVSFDLRNGDQLTGVLTLGSVKLETVFGKVSIDINHIRALSVMLPRGGLPDELRNGLMLYYPFDLDGGMRVADRSGQGNHGAVEGAVWTPDGKVGGAYEFNGRDSYMDAGKSTNLNPREALTLAVWVKPDRRVRSGTGFGSVIIRWDTMGGVNERTYLLGMDQAMSVMRARVSSDGTEGGVAQPMGSTLAGNETWCHFACVWDGAQVSLFRDGERVDSVPCAGIKISPSTRTGIGAAIGRSGDPSISHFCGAIDEVMIWNRALSPEEVKRLYEAQK